MLPSRQAGKGFSAWLGVTDRCAVLLVALATAGHAIIYKRDPRSAALWVLLAWLLPILGAILYVFFGVNRVQRRAARMRRDLVRLRTTSGSDERLPVTGDFTRALQVLVNLLTNAIRYTPEGGQVWVRLEREGDLAAVIVADQGKGIDPSDQERIFEKFERLDPNEQGGTGLGLYIARRLARAMGGDISVDSAPGQGARFTFTLPRDQ